MDEEVVIPACYTACVMNPFCPDKGEPREVFIIAETYYCWCGSRMQPPLCSGQGKLDAWVSEFGLELVDYGHCNGNYHQPEIAVGVELPPIE